ncbi:MAG: hypothetical protein HQ538_00765 [Parcubacteria group bacterium]|nr:hypothetical protein [Parcubacteria group bacterium]
MSRDIFEIFSIFYLILLLINQIKLGFVSDFINLNHILIIVVISGIISLYKINTETTIRDYIFIITLALIGASTIFYKTSVFGSLKAFIFATLSFVFIILVLFFLLKR